MRVYHWRVAYRDYEDKLVTDRSLSGIWRSKVGEDEVASEITDYLSEVHGVDPEDVYRLDIIPDDENEY